jgi:hypothetical protein
LDEYANEIYLVLLEEAKAKGSMMDFN